MSTEQVKTWVATVLAVVLGGHLAEAMVIFALLTSPSHPATRIGLLVIAGIVGLLTAGGVRAIHGRRLISGWLLLGLAPAAIGVYVGWWA